jgi:6-phosphofructokinase 1
MVVEIMGHNTGWLAACAGLAGGADVVLIPEIPYSIEIVSKEIIERTRKGKSFSIVAVAEGAIELEGIISNGDKSKKRDKKKKKNFMYPGQDTAGARITREISERTGLETRLTTLGHTQRGGTPSSYDRILATQLGTKATELAAEGVSGIMIAIRGGKLVNIPLEQVAGKRKNMPLDHPVIQSLRALQICLGDPSSLG